MHFTGRLIRVSRVGFEGIPFTAQARQNVLRKALAEARHECGNQKRFKSRAIGGHADVEIDYLQVDEQIDYEGEESAGHWTRHPGHVDHPNAGLLA